MENKENKESTNPIYKQIEELLKKNQQQTQNSLVAFQKAMEGFNQAVLKLGLDAQHPSNPSIKNLSLEALEVLANGLNKVPNIDPIFAQQALSLFKKMQEKVIFSKKIAEAEKMVKKLEQEIHFNENINVRFAKILKAAQLQSSQYPTTISNKK